MRPDSSGGLRYFDHGNIRFKTRAYLIRPSLLHRFPTRFAQYGEVGNATTKLGKRSKHKSPLSSSIAGTVAYPSQISSGVFAVVSWQLGVVAGAKRPGAAACVPAVGSGGAVPLRYAEVLVAAHFAAVVALYTALADAVPGAVQANALRHVALAQTLDAAPARLPAKAARYAAPVEGWADELQHDSPADVRWISPEDVPAVRI